MTRRLANKPTCMAETALEFIRRSSTRLSCPSSSPRALTPPRCYHRSFSISTHALLRKAHLRFEGYPGFRNESKERRLVREHNLFDPQARSSDNIDHASSSSDTLESARVLTHKLSTLPRNQASTPDLERELSFIASRYPTDTRTRNLLHFILYDRKQPPAAVHYEALILANVSPEFGSAGNVRKLVKEMEAFGISTNVNIYNAILRTLVVHPDIDLLNTVIEACGKMWIEIDLEMQHLVCATYIRAGMPEIALEYLDQIEHGTGHTTLGVTRTGLQKGKAELWLYVVFIQQLVERGDWDAVMLLCYRLCDDTSLGIPIASRHMDLPYDFGNWLLKQSAAAKEKFVTFWIWETYVLKARVRPSIETCLQVLEICADHGAARIAETASMIIRLINRDANEPGQDHDDGPGSSPLRNQDFEKIYTLLAKTHKNAPPEQPHPSELEVRRLTAEWWMFEIKDKIGLSSRGQKGRRSLKLDPWSTLREINDPGHAWARRLSEKRDRKQMSDERRALIQFNVRRAGIHRSRDTMMKTLPPRLFADIERAANAGLDIEEPDITTDDATELATSDVPWDSESTKSTTTGRLKPQSLVRKTAPKPSSEDILKDEKFAAEWDQLSERELEGVVSDIHRRLNEYRGLQRYEEGAKTDAAIVKSPRRTSEPRRVRLAHSQEAFRKSGWGSTRAGVEKDVEQEETQKVEGKVGGQKLRDGIQEGRVEVELEDSAESRRHQGEGQQSRVSHRSPVQPSSSWQPYCN